MVAVGLHLENADGITDLPKLDPIRPTSVVGVQMHLSALRFVRDRYGAKVYLRFFIRNLLTEAYSTVTSDLDKCVTQMTQASITDLTIGNELNLAIEGTVFTPEDTARKLKPYLEYVRAKYPSVRLHLPAFGGGNWWDYARACQTLGSLVQVVDLHAYGSLADIQAAYRSLHLLFPNHPICITEFNWGAGNTVNPEAWGDSTILPLYTGLPSYVEAAHYFIWSWINPDPYGGPSVDLYNRPHLSALFQRAREAVVPVLGTGFRQLQDRYPSLVGTFKILPNGDYQSYVFPGTASEFCIGISDKGTAYWYRGSNRTTFVPTSGRWVLDNLGNAGDGSFKQMYG